MLPEKNKVNAQEINAQEINDHELEQVVGGFHLGEFFGKLKKAAESTVNLLKFFMKKKDEH